MGSVLLNFVNWLKGVVPMPLLRHERRGYSASRANAHGWKIGAIFLLAKKLLPLHLNIH